MDLGLKDKVVFVTGSGRGIGRSIAEKYAAEGSIVVISDIDENTAKTTAEEIKNQFKVETACYKHDVSSSVSCASVFEDIVKKFGKIDVLVNNAGITKDNLMLRMTDEDWQAVININLTGVFYCTREAVKHMMKARFGRIVNIASVVGVIGNAGQANYSSAKGGVIALTKTTAKEMASRNINVNAVAPGFIETAMTAKLPENVVEQMKNATPLKRFGNVNDVANAVLFLSSTMSNYITGEVIAVDGGMIM